MAKKRGLSFDQLRAANIKRLPVAKTKDGKLYHTLPNGKDWTPSEWFQYLVGELGEFAGWAKKLKRGTITKAEFLREGAKELADVQCYLDILALQYDIDLGEATRQKFNEVSRRFKCKVKL